MLYSIFFFGSLSLWDILKILKKINLFNSYSWDKFNRKALFLMLMIGVKMYNINIYN